MPSAPGGVWWGRNEGREGGDKNEGGRLRVDLVVEYHI